MRDVRTSARSDLTERVFCRENDLVSFYLAFN